MDGRFDDGKDDEALRTIGEVALALGIKPHVLRYWEQQFPSLRPLKRSGGRRYYRPADVALVERIDRLVNEDGYTLKGARKVIADMNEEAAENAGSRAGENTPEDRSVSESSMDRTARGAITVSSGDLVDQAASDGGLDAFFGRKAAEAPSAAVRTERDHGDRPEAGEPMPTGTNEAENPTFVAASDPGELSLLEVADQLRSIRDRLAAAIQA